MKRTFRQGITLLPVLLAGCVLSAGSRPQSTERKLVPIPAPSQAVSSNPETKPFDRKPQASVEEDRHTGVQTAGWRATSASTSEELVTSSTTVEQTAFKQDAATKPARLPADNPDTLQLEDVIESVLHTFPMVQAAALQFEVANGQMLAAEGAFDTKLKGASENGPLGFYETYRHSIGAVQPLAYGGEVFAGYRVGRGVFQPWYQERQTNEGGEFKAGVAVPLSRNVEIDERRAGVRKANIDQAAADPLFRGEVIRTVQSASEAYWEWVAAAEQRRIAERVLLLATKRNDGLEEEVRTGAQAPPVLKDNRRSILSREAKLIDTERKLQQTAAKLSIYLRTMDGEPRIPSTDSVPEFPAPDALTDDSQSELVRQAILNRPELRDLDLAMERIDIELAEAGNDLLPNVDAVVTGSQDVGEPTSKKQDKSPFELEAALLVDVPLQRRKAHGKLDSLEAKRTQLAQKRRLSEDKIRTDIAVAVAAVSAAYQRVERTREARELADYMAEIEREKFRAGESDLLKVALREEYAAESASKAIDALLEYQLGRAALRAAVGVDDGAVSNWSP